MKTWTWLFAASILMSVPAVAQADALASTPMKTLQFTNPIVETFRLQRFDPAWGALFEVRIDAYAYASLIFPNPDPTQSADACGGGEVNISDLFGIGLSDLNFCEGDQWGPTLSAFLYGAEQVGPVNLTNGASYLTRFIGTSSEVLDVERQYSDFDIVSNHQYFYGAKVSDAISIRTFGSGTVTYTFAPVPEPYTWASMLVGFALLGLSLRAKKREAASAPITTSARSTFAATKAPMKSS